MLSIALARLSGRGKEQYDPSSPGPIQLQLYREFVCLLVSATTQLLSAMPF